MSSLSLWVQLLAAATTLRIVEPVFRTKSSTMLGGLSLNQLMDEGLLKTDRSRNFKTRVRRELENISASDKKQDAEERAETNAKSKLVTSLLDSILDNYDMYIRPGFGESPLHVESNMVLTSMGPFSDFEAEFTFQCFFRHFWIDKRLAFQNHSLFDTYQSAEEVKELILNSIMLERVWKPDTFFRGNGLNSHIHDITRPNQLFRLRNDGYIIFSTRLTVSAKCPMDFSRYPMDSQKCLVEFGSFGYPLTDLRYSWKSEGPPVDLSTANTRLAQFTLYQIDNSSRVLQTNTSGNYSILSVRFLFKRNIGYFVMQTYMPCMMIVKLSWIAFWINREAAPARISLGITTVLTMTTFAISSRQQIPKVSYPSAMDWFVLMCYLFVFLALVEYAAINYFTKRGEAGKAPKKPAPKAEGSAVQNSGQDGTVQGGPGNSTLRSGEISSQDFDDSDLPPFESMNSVAVRFLVCITGSRQYRKWKIEHITTQYNSVSRIDEICRKAFPFAFGVFNAIYWSIYLGHENEEFENLDPAVAI